ncbi:QPCT cyclotransferase, partial [Pomatorhinus ruficollis]|nr:QPCT cyclotransferase [Pomatorhinus ruficollis]
CALLLELVVALDTHLRERGGQAPAVTLGGVFLDGEEAFGDWSVTDSLWGGRHLAAKMA